MAGAQTYTNNLHRSSVGTIKDLRHKTTGEPLFRGETYSPNNLLASIRAKQDTALQGGQYEEARVQKAAKAKTRAESLVNTGKTATNHKSNNPGRSSRPALGGQVKRSRAEGAKSAKSKSILSNNPSDDKLG